ncbi:unnamed protein product [Protopolystoma xenopodis]|uniref:Uncharacterized protein n=1 Tax=Protopolystoma xenopodis TaxID=117903 RepID=A0A3S5FFK8_9PLAT|nr:unnamed protein product [Protopolystoma xenopodis]
MAMSCQLMHPAGLYTSTSAMPPCPVSLSTYGPVDVDGQTRSSMSAADIWCQPRVSVGGMPCPDGLPICWGGPIPWQAFYSLPGLPLLPTDTTGALQRGGPLAVELSPNNTRSLLAGCVTGNGTIEQAGQGGSGGPMMGESLEFVGGAMSRGSGRKSSGEAEELGTTCLAGMTRASGDSLDAYEHTFPDSSTFQQQV